MQSPQKIKTIQLDSWYTQQIFSPPISKGNFVACNRIQVLDGIGKHWKSNNKS
jgi:hypothetical protein